MIHKDTVRLLRECGSGAKTGVESIGEVLPSVEDRRLKELLDESRRRHRALGDETDRLLAAYGDSGGEPGAVALGMSRVKNGMTLMMHAGRKDAAAAELVTDGCNMGVKSLSRYLNEYAAADEPSKEVAKKLIRLEEQLSRDLRDWL